MANDGEEEQYTPGWYGTLQEAANAAVQEEGVDFEHSYDVTFQARKKNPLHEYKANLRPAD
jgi:hypothetical protein